jgi:hypothetical protein
MIGALGIELIMNDGDQQLVFRQNGGNLLQTNTLAGSLKAVLVLRVLMKDPIAELGSG